MKPNFPEEIKTARLVLKKSKPTIKRAEVMFKVVEENRERLREWFDWEPKTRTVEDSLYYLFDTEKKCKDGEKVDYNIFLNKEYIGNIGIFDISQEHKSAEVGYWLTKTTVRQGIMTEALQAVEKEFFDNQNLIRMQLQCDTRNIASAGVAEKNGYTKEGLKRSDKFDELKQEFRDHFVFSKLKSEYEEQKQN